VPQNVKDGIVITDPKSVEERRQVAKDFTSQFKLTLPILIDAIDDAAEKAFAGWPDRIYVLDAQGKVAFKGQPGPRGFKVDEVAPELDKLLKK